MWPVRSTSIISAFLSCIYVVDSLKDAAQSDILVPPLFADEDDDSALLVPPVQAPTVQPPQPRAFRSAKKLRTAPTGLRLSNDISAAHAFVAPPTLQTARQSDRPAVADSGLGTPADEHQKDNFTEQSTHATKGLNNQERMNKLIDHLIGPQSHYHRHLRPLPDCSAHDCSHKIGVTMSLQFQKLLSVDEKANQLEMLALVILDWPDHRLSYNATEWFSNLFHWRSDHDFIAIDPHMVWQPDVQLVNAAVPMEKIFEPRAYLFDDTNRINKGFNVRLKVPNIIKVKCDLIMDDFPFDNQTCNFVFQAWSASNSWISFKGSKEVNENDTIAGMTSKNEEFRVTDVDMRDSSIQVGQNVFPQIIYTLKMKRYSHYYVSSIILPILMMVMLSVGVFYIDPPGGERLGYNITLILTVMATSFFAAERLPKSGGGDTWLERFQAACYIITILPLVLSLLCELGRRLAKKAGKAGEDEEGGWVTHVCDVIFRVPYAVGVLIFIYVVAGKFWIETGDTEESVLALLLFLFIMVAVMCIVGIVDLVWEVRNGKLV